MICIVSHNQLREWEKTGKRPDCKYHHHTTYKKANVAVMCDNAFWITGQRAVVIYDGVLRYEWRGKRSDHYSCMQMVPVGT